MTPTPSLNSRSDSTGRSHRASDGGGDSGGPRCQPASRRALSRGDVCPVQTSRRAAGAMDQTVALPFRTVASARKAARRNEDPGRTPSPPKPSARAFGGDPSLAGPPRHGRGEPAADFGGATDPVRIAVVRRSGGRSGIGGSGLQPLDRPAPVERPSGRARRRTACGHGPGRSGWDLWWSRVVPDPRPCRGPRARSGHRSATRRSTARRRCYASSPHRRPGLRARCTGSVRVRSPDHRSVADPADAPNRPRASHGWPPRPTSPARSPAACPPPAPPPARGFRPARSARPGSSVTRSTSRLEMRARSARPVSGSLTANPSTSTSTSSGPPPRSCGEAGPRFRFGGPPCLPTRRARAPRSFPRTRQLVTGDRDRSRRRDGGDAVEPDRQRPERHGQRLIEARHHVHGIGPGCVTEPARMDDARPGSTPPSTNPRPRRSSRATRRPVPPPTPAARRSRHPSPGRRSGRGPAPRRPGRRPAARGAARTRRSWRALPGAERHDLGRAIATMVSRPPATRIPARRLAAQHLGGRSLRDQLTFASSRM